MFRLKVRRREALLGSLAAALTATPYGLGGREARMADDALVEAIEDAMEAEASHAPFRAAFLNWFQDVSGRIALPVLIRAASPRQTELHVPGLHPAISIILNGNTDINVFVEWKGICWDTLTSMDVYAELTEDGTGWQSTLLIPEAMRLHPTQDACWREDGFEWLLKWLNEDLATATHLALYGGEGCYEDTGWTSAYLARDGTLVNSGRPISSNSSLRELLPLHSIHSQERAAIKTI